MYILCIIDFIMIRARDYYMHLHFYTGQKRKGSKYQHFTSNLTIGQRFIGNV